MVNKDSIDICIKGWYRYKNKIIKRIKILIKLNNGIKFIEEFIKTLIYFHIDYIYLIKMVYKRKIT